MYVIIPINFLIQFLSQGGGGVLHQTYLHPLAFCRLTVNLSPAKSFLVKAHPLSHSDAVGADKLVCEMR